jgi:hypothetical protein
MNIIQFIEDPNLINDQSLSPAQKMALKAVYGLPLAESEMEIFRQTTGLREYFLREWDEASFILGRRSGKSDKLASNIALYEASIREHNFSKGEIGVVMLVSSELRRQSRILYSYILHKLQASPFLSKLVSNVTAEEIALTNGVIIQVYPCNVARIRGASLIAFIGDEVAHWKVEGRDIDVDVLDSARPGLSFPYSKMIKISSPYMMKGEIYQDFNNYYGKSNEDILVFQGSTELFNPGFSRIKLEKLKRRKPLTYQTEFQANFRTDLSAMYGPEIIDKVVNYDRPLELRRIEDFSYKAFVDVAGGGGSDSYAVAIGHLEREKIIIDVIRARQPKFNPEEVTGQYCQLLGEYSVFSVVGDRYSGDWALNSFQSNGVHYEKCEKPKSELYLEAESIFNTGRIEIPNRESLIAQLKNLIRKARSGGRDFVDSDYPEDEANVVVGLIHLLTQDLNYVRTPPPSLGYLEVVKNPEELMDEKAIDWLMGRSKGPISGSKKDDPFDEFD